MKVDGGGAAVARVLDSARRILLQRANAPTARVGAGDELPTPRRETTPEAELARAQALLRAAERVLASRPAAQPRSPATTCPAPAPRGPDVEARAPVDVVAVRACLDRGRDVLQRRADQAAGRVPSLLADLVGLPLPLNAFSLLGAVDRERSFQAMLAWLLDPTGTHGLRAAVLRRFLGLAGLSLRREVAAARVVIVDEFSIDVASGSPEVRRADEVRASAIRVDLLLLLPPTAVVVELKVTSPESTYIYGGKRWAQAALYTRAIRDFVDAPQSSRAATPFRERVEAAARGRMVAGRPLLDDLARCTRVVGTIVHLGDAAPCRREERRATGVAHDEEHAQRVVHVDWRDVGAAVAASTQHAEPAPQVQFLVRSFHEAIYRNLAFDGDDIFHVADEVRHWSHDEHYRRLRGITGHVHFDRLHRALSGRPSCVQETRPASQS